MKLKPKVSIAKNYIYRMDHDTGFAPHIKKPYCFLSGCKKTTIEKWAKEGSWVVGIGGNFTKQPDKLIYMMKVKENLLYRQFKKLYPNESQYLHHDKAGTNVLISEHFCYFGEDAIDFPSNLKSLIIGSQGCKCLTDEEVQKLEKYLHQKGKWGNIGNPNNPPSKESLCNPKC